jgi:predicted dinucleotide-binding enzyme
MNRVLTVLLLFTSILMCPTNVMSDDLETVAIIGTGDLGDSFGPRLAKLGYKVVYGSRTPDSDKVRALVVATGNGATASSQKEAAQRGDIVMLAVPWPAMETVAQSLGNLDGKIVIDVSAPWTQGDDGYPENQVETSSAELIQQWNPGAKVVKGLGTMESGIIDDPGAAGGMVTIPVASDHRDAKERVARIVHELGLDPVDFGPLRMARHIESLQILYMIPIVQRRTTKWEFYFRRTHRPCEWVQADWFVSAYDTDQLAEMPETEIVPKTCP